MNEERRSPGRPRIYEKRQDAVNAYRRRRVAKGDIAINVFLPPYAKKLLDRYCGFTGMKQGELLAYLLVCAVHDEPPSLPEVDLAECFKELAAARAEASENPE